MKEEGEIRGSWANEEKKTSSSAGHHLPRDQLSIGTTAAERHLNHLCPHVDRVTGQQAEYYTMSQSTCINM